MTAGEPSPDVMERAKRLLYDGICPNIISGNADCDYPDCRESLCEFWKNGDVIARALNDYGNERAREMDEWYKSRLEHADGAIREARAAVIEEAKQVAVAVADEELPPVLANKQQAWASACGRILTRLCILANTPPQYPATGWLKQAQEVLDGTAPPSRRGGAPGPVSQSEADVMERARQVVRIELAHQSDTHIKAVARALTEYGDERAAEARAAALDRVLGILDEEDWLGYSKDRICARIRALANEVGNANSVR